MDNSKYYCDFQTKGSCNYAFVIIFQKKFRNFYFRDKFEKVLKKNKIEFRRGTAGGGNQSKQPYLNYFKGKFEKSKVLKNTDIVHDFGFYIGNYPELKIEKINTICKILNNI